jgi:hypothetical protein
MISHVISVLVNVYDIIVLSYDITSQIFKMIYMYDSM